MANLRGPFRNKMCKYQLQIAHYSVVWVKKQKLQNIISSLRYSKFFVLRDYKIIPQFNLLVACQRSVPPV